MRSQSLLGVRGLFAFEKFLNTTRKITNSQVLRSKPACHKPENLIRDKLVIFQKRQFFRAPRIHLSLRPKCKFTNKVCNAIFSSSLWTPPHIAVAHLEEERSHQHRKYLQMTQNSHPEALKEARK